MHVAKKILLGHLDYGLWYLLAHASTLASAGIHMLKKREAPLLGRWRKLLEDLGRGWKKRKRKKERKKEREKERKNERKKKRKKEKRKQRKRQSTKQRKKQNKIKNRMGLWSLKRYFVRLEKKSDYFIESYHFSNLLLYQFYVMANLGKKEFITCCLVNHFATFLLKRVTNRYENPCRKIMTQNFSEGLQNVNACSHVFTNTHWLYACG